MRKLMWLTAGFGAACCVGAYLGYEKYLLVLGCASVFLCVVAALVGSRFRKLLPAAYVLLGLGLGFFRFWLYDTNVLLPARELDGITTRATIIASDFSFETDYGCAFDGDAMWQGRNYHVRIYLDENKTVLPGDAVTGSFRFRYTHTGGEKKQTYHRGDGILLLGYQRGEASVIPQNAAPRDYPAANIRNRLNGFLNAIFPEDTGIFARALLIGDDSDLDYETNTAFELSGIRHIISVSGLHVSVLFAVVYVLSGKRPWLLTLLGLPVLLLFAAVAGFTPSVIRACIMHALMILAMLLRREYDPPTALAFSALTMLVVQPLVITSVGFQLSVGCMVGIFLFAVPIKDWLLDEKRLGCKEGKSFRAQCMRSLAGSISVSLGAISITTPLSALYFGTVSLVSVISNFLTLWMVSLVFYGIVGVCLLGTVWQAGAGALAWVLSWPTRYILGISSFLAELPFATVYTRSGYIVAWLVGIYLLLGMFLWMKKKHPVTFASIGILGLCLALLLSWAVPMGDACRMTVLDVGQGQSIVLQHGKKTFLVDCGGDYPEDAADIAAETLMSMGIYRIHGLILTHYDADHAGGAVHFLSRVKADSLYLPQWEGENETAARLHDYCDGMVHSITRETSLNWNGGCITLYPSTILDSGNESSMCVLFQAEDCDILITGDRSTLGEALLLKQAQLPQLDILVAGHHGSRYSTGEALLEATKPKIVAISVEENSPYGHPSQQLLDRLAKYDCTVYRTDLHGTLIFRR